MQKDFIGSKIALIHDGELLVMLRDNKPDLIFAGLWDLPGGGREGNESPEICAIREVKEELNITLMPEQIIWKSEHAGVQDPSVKAYFFVAPITDEQLDSVVFGGEGQCWKMATYDWFLESDKVVQPLRDRFKIFLDSTNQR